MCDRDGSNPVQLTFFGGPQIGTPSWSPDSRRIVFDLRASSNAELYTVNVDGGHVWSVAVSQAVAIPPRTSQPLPFGPLFVVDALRQLCGRASLSLRTRLPSAFRRNYERHAAPQPRPPAVRRRTP